MAVALYSRRLHHTQYFIVNNIDQTVFLPEVYVYMFFHVVLNAQK